MKKEKIFIAIPTEDSFIHCDLAGVLFYWGSHYPLHIVFAQRATPLHAARNILLEAFLKSDCDYLFFIDDDIVPPNNALDDLLAADKEIISPGTLMPKEIGVKAKIPVPTAMRRRNPADEGYYPCWGEGVEEVDTIGGGAYLVRRHVFEDRPYKYRFEYENNGARKKGADVAFSEDMRARGYKLYVHFGIPCRHVRTIDLLEVHNALKLLTNGKD
jgi:glycosyltransferase involved in cell wall biosynthesis